MDRRQWSRGLQLLALSALAGQRHLARRAKQTSNQDAFISGSSGLSQARARGAILGRPARAAEPREPDLRTARSPCADLADGGSSCSPCGFGRSLDCIKRLNRSTGWVMAPSAATAATTMDGCLALRGRSARHVSHVRRYSYGSGPLRLPVGEQAHPLHGSDTLFKSRIGIDVQDTPGEIFPATISCWSTGSRPFRWRQGPLVLGWLHPMGGSSLPCSPWTRRCNI